MERGSQAGYQIDEETEDLDLIYLLESIKAEESSETEIIELDDRENLVLLQSVP